MFLPALPHVFVYPLRTVCVSSLSLFLFLHGNSIPSVILHVEVQCTEMPVERGEGIDTATVD